MGLLAAMSPCDRGAATVKVISTSEQSIHFMHCLGKPGHRLTTMGTHWNSKIGIASIDWTDIPARRSRGLIKTNRDTPHSEYRRVLCSIVIYVQGLYYFSYFRDCSLDGEVFRRESFVL